MEFSRRIISQDEIAWCLTLKKCITIAAAAASAVTMNAHTKKNRTTARYVLQFKMLMSNNGNKIKFNWIIVDVFLSSIGICMRAAHSINKNSTANSIWYGHFLGRYSTKSRKRIQLPLNARNAFCSACANAVADNLCVNDWSGHSSNGFLVQMTLDIVDDEEWNQNITTFVEKSNKLKSGEHFEDFFKIYFERFEIFNYLPLMGHLCLHL